MSPSRIRVVCLPGDDHGPRLSGEFYLNPGGGGVAQGFGGWLCWPVAAPIGLSPLNLLL